MSDLLHAVQRCLGSISNHNGLLVASKEEEEEEGGGKKQRKKKEEEDKKKKKKKKKCWGGIRKGFRNARPMFAVMSIFGSLVDFPAD